MQCQKEHNDQPHNISDEHGLFQYDHEPNHIKYVFYFTRGENFQTTRRIKDLDKISEITDKNTFGMQDSAFIDINHTERTLIETK